MIKKILLSCGLFTILTMASPAAMAVIQLPDYLRPDNLPESTAAEALSEDHPETAATQTLILYVGNLVSQVLLFMGSIAVIFIILAGANYILAFGKDERIERGKRGIFWSLMGLITILFSYAIVQGVISVILQVDSSTG
jgi:hypothetical protein